VVEYTGTRYHGFQLQAEAPTVQGELEKALWELTREKTRVACASRTDSGVHASGQVVSFKTASAHPPSTFITGLSFYLPRDIAVREAHRVRNSFSVRRSAISRQYHYYILNRKTRSPLWNDFACCVSGELDTEAMNQACQALIGKHDFISFTSRLGKDIKSTVRNVYRAEVRRAGELVTFTMVANAFLPHQVRNTVGALIQVGLGRMKSQDFYSIMGAKQPGLAGPSAPACGLYLIQVNYPRAFEEEIV